MAYRTPPFLTPIAIVTMIIALSATNVIVNKATNTSEGAPVRSSKVVEAVNQKRNLQATMNILKINRKSRHRVLKKAASRVKILQAVGKLHNH